MGLTRVSFYGIDTSTVLFKDPITVLNSASTQANTDVGLLLNRSLGTTSNVALYWNESGNTFVTAFTANTGVVSANIQATSFAPIKTGNLTTTGYANTYIATGSVSNTSAMTISGNVYGRGGVGYLDAMQLTNSYSGATNPTKYIRVNQTGGLEIINSAYTAQIFSVSDAGIVNAGSQLNVGGLQAVNGPAFQAYLLQSQTFTTGSTANVVYQGALYDTHSCYNTSTGVFKPNVAGYYQFNWTAGANSYPASTGIVTSSLRRNNMEYARGFRGVCNSGGMVTNGSASCYLNGTTDIVYITFLQGSGGSATLESDSNALSNPGSYANYFSGQMVRGA